MSMLFCSSPNIPAQSDRCIHHACLLCSLINISCKNHRPQAREEPLGHGFLFHKDKGFFFKEGIDAQLVAMSPPVHIVPWWAGELDFSTTLGAEPLPSVRGSSLKRVFYVRQDPTFCSRTQPGILMIRELTGKVIGVNAPTDAMGMSAKMILKGNRIDRLRSPSFSTQVTENAYKALLEKRIAATYLPPPYAEEAEQKVIAASRNQGLRTAQHHRACGFDASSGKKSRRRPGRHSSHA